MPGPANLYGVANPVILPVIQTGSGLINLPAGTETTILSATLAAISSGFYYPLIWATVAFQFGATVSSTGAIAFKIGAGSDVDNYAVANSNVYASSIYTVSVCLVGVPSNTAWAGAGSTINLTATVQTTAAQISGNSTRAVFALFRAPDQ